MSKIDIPSDAKYICSMQFYFVYLLYEVLNLLSVRPVSLLLLLLLHVKH